MGENGLMAGRSLLLFIFSTLAFFGGAEAVVAQDVENGQRLSERLCSECHIVRPAQTKSRGAPPFAAIAARNTVSADMIVSFLLLPHATMPSPPLSRKDAEDIAAFILGMRK
jgi:mono/diheme cytochrome c family protein